MRTRFPFVLVAVGLLLLVASGCGRNTGEEDPQVKQAREEMATRLQRGGVVNNPRIIHVMRLFPRHELVPAEMLSYAYGDQPIPLPNGKVLSSPTLAGMVLQELNPMPRHTVLMVEAPDPAIPLLASRLCRRVVVIALLEADAALIRELATQMGANNVEAHSCDVVQGWAAAAPYSSVLFAYDPYQVPTKIVEQVADNGVLVVFDGPYARQIRVMRLIEGEVGEPRIVNVPGGA